MESKVNNFTKAGDVSALYSQDEIKKIIMIDSPIRIVKSKANTVPENLILVVNDPSNKEPIDALRGIIVDFKSKRIVSRPVIGFNELNMVTSDKIEIQDDNYMIDNITYPISTSIFRRVYDGILIRVMWYEDKLVLSSSSMIGLDNSYYRTEKVYDIVISVLPSKEEMFDTTKAYSSTVYHFLVVDNVFSHVSEQPDERRIVYISQQEWNCEYESVSPGHYKYEDKIYDIISYEDANLFLKNGYGKEGEAIVISNVDGSDMMRVNSTEYARKYRIFDWHTEYSHIRILQLIDQFKYASIKEIKAFGFNMTSEEQDKIEKLRKSRNRESVNEIGKIISRNMYECIPSTVKVKKDEDFFNKFINSVNKAINDIIKYVIKSDKLTCDKEKKYSLILKSKLQKWKHTTIILEITDNLNYSDLKRQLYNIIGKMTFERRYQLVNFINQAKRVLN